MLCTASQLQKCERVVLAIPDLHCPFHHREAFDFLEWLKRKYQPDTTVNLGDEVDSHAISFHPVDPDGLSPGDELEAAVKALKPFYELFPTVSVCTSNHTARVYRKAFAAGLPKRVIRGYRDWLEAPDGWEWADDWTVDGVAYEHGEGVSGRQGALKAAEGNMRPTVIGHLHSHAGIQYAANRETIYYGFNAGCLIDRHAYSMKYAKHIKAKPTLGAGVIIKGVPQFIPMLLNRRGRWVKAA